MEDVGYYIKHLKLLNLKVDLFILISSLPLKRKNVFVCIGIKLEKNECFF